MQVLESQLGERLLRPSSDVFDAAVQVEFAGEQRVPAAVVQVADTEEVAATVRAARDGGMPVAVRSGGHSYARHGLADGALVIDTRRMDGVDIDAAAQTGWAQAGVTAGAYTRTAGAHGLATGFGDAPTVGVAGVALGGGIGFLSRRDGLTVDNIVSAEVVLADGRVVVADSEQHRDLFWALRGGGGNFGVVTRLGLHLRPTKQVTGGMLAFPPTPELVAGAVNAVVDAPDGLSAMINVMKAPPAPFLPEAMHGEPLVLVLLCWSGPPEEAEAAIAPMRALGPALVDQVAERPYPEMLEGPPSTGEVAHPVMRTGFVDRPDAAWGAAAIDGIAAAVSPVAAVNIRPMGGAIGRVAGDSTAFAHRDHDVMASVAGVFPDATLAPDVNDWATRTAGALGIGGGGYVNFMSTATQADVDAAYPGATLDRLRQVKRTYDPDNVFRSNHNITPG
ncbi:FAD-binding oxidoreductase [Georgenia halophila]|uniref:FAD-binding oxidoreductase n=1 Tax=Georgenia halophila TaxID=620889 RepID=A0ABP8LAZ6_9MICO